jgi:hypothetical protein
LKFTVGLFLNRLFLGLFSAIAIFLWSALILWVSVCFNGNGDPDS